MGSDIRHVRGEAQKELVKKFEVFTSNLAVKARFIGAAVNGIAPAQFVTQL